MVRNPILLLLALITFACGPSSTEVKTAKEARYKGDKAAIFAAAKDAVETKYKIHDIDESTLTIKTEVKWFNPDGGGAMVADGDEKHMPNRAVSIVNVVQVLPEGDSWIVSIHQLMRRHIAGQPNNDVLPEGDPSIPGFAHDQADTLAFTIHDALKQFEIQTVPQQVSAPPPPAAPAGGGY